MYQWLAIVDWLHQTEFTRIKPAAGPAWLYYTLIIIVILNAASVINIIFI